MSADAEAPRKKVLIVDDDVPMAGLLQLFFRFEDVDLDLAATGSEALEKLAADDVDLLVLDLMLPEVGGLEIIRELQQRKRSPAILVITSQAGDATSEERLRAEPNVAGYFRKPFDQQRFLQAARAILAGR
ncbi:MAG: response regulator [Elusimicrobia bacterium]|nr:response regulator [Elusimicrobiota bacterium]